jgi:HlyD family secretion protein
VLTRSSAGGSRPKAAWRYAAAAALVLQVGVGWSWIGEERSVAHPLSTAIVVRRDFVEIVRLYGTIEAVTSRTVVAPRPVGERAGALVITKLAAPGARVQPGDVLAELDAQTQRQALQDVEAAYGDQRDETIRKEAEGSALSAQGERQLEEAEHALQAARLDVRRNEILSRIDAEKNQQRLQVATERLTLLREMAALRRLVGRTEARMLTIGRERAGAALAAARRNVETMTIRSPQAGVVVRPTLFGSRGPTEVREGQEISPGTAFLEVVDPAAMRVRARVNQIDAVKLAAGQPATVHLDAYPEAAFSGHVSEVGGFAQSGTFSARVREITTLFSVEGATSQLMPDLSAALDVEILRVPRVLIAPRDAVVSIDGRAYMRVRSGHVVERRAVTLGAMSDVEVVVASGVEEGATVLRGPEVARGEEP